MAAAIRRLSTKFIFSSQLTKPNSDIPILSSVIPTLLISTRFIASKLFVGDIQVQVVQLGLEYNMGNKKVSRDFAKCETLNFFDPISLSFYTNEQRLSEAFSEYGQVIEAKIVMDRASDRSKGFGFVTYASEDEAEKAITEMNGKQLNGRVVFVDYAKPQKVSRSAVPIARGPPNPVP